MKHRKNRRRDFASLCGELHADDGVDPREAFSRESRKAAPREDRKARQLCKQVQRALSIALAGETGDPLLGEIEIVRVEPAPDDTRLRVVVATHANSPASMQDALDALSRAAGYLRACVAQWITRKRTPELAFSFEHLALPNTGPALEDEA